MKHTYFLCFIAFFILLQSGSSIGSTITPQNTYNSSFNFTSSLNAIFFKVPSSAQISQLIINADVSSLLKVVQILGQQSSLKCYDVLSYFLQINGKIHSVLVEKQVEIARLQTIFRIAQKSIEQMKTQIQRSNGWQRVLQLSNNKMELTQKLDNLTRLYNLYNQVDTAIEPEQAKIIGYEQEIKNIQFANEGERKNLLEQQLKLARIESSISQLQQKLREEQKNKDKSRDRITGLKMTINDNQIKIATIKNIISNSKRAIEGLTKKATTVRSYYSQAEIQAIKLRDQINDLQKKEDELSNYIRNLEEKVRKEEAKLEYYKLENLSFQTNQLKILLPNVENAIEEQYTKCYNTNGDFMKIVKVNGKVLYVFTPTNFIIYMGKVYANLPEPSVHALVLLSKVDIKAKQWVNTYGNPSYSLEYLGLKYPGVNKQLVCIDMQSVEYGEGKITRISNYEVEIESIFRRKIFLIVTQCSVIESSTMMPKIGQNIYWKGVSMQNLNNYVQLYWATSF